MESQQEIVSKTREPLLKPKPSSPSEAVSPNVQGSPRESSKTSKASKEIRAIRLGLSRVTQKYPPDNKNGQPHSSESKPDGFEPFLNPQTSESPFFVNGYVGNFAQQMELNRGGIGKILKIAHLDGTIILSSLTPSRNRSADGVNQDGSVAQRKRLSYGEKIEDEDKNPLHRVIPTPQGWRIEINDAKIMEELEVKRIMGEKLAKEFAGRFNDQLAKSMWECVWKEKLTRVKNESIVRSYKVVVLQSAEVFAGTILMRFLLVSSGLLPELASWLTASGIAVSGIALGNFITTSINEKKFLLREHVDSFLEYFMPPIEIDKVVRTFTRLFVSGGILVREKQHSK